MSKENFQVKLAKHIKGFENKSFIGNVIGKVIKPLPDLQISILDEQVILYPEQLYLDAKWWNDYTREFKIEGSDFELKGDKFSLSANPFVIQDTTPSSPRPVATIPEGQTSNVEIGGKADNIGSITYTDTLKEGDLVLLIPTFDEQTWFVSGKIKKVKE